MTTFNLNLVKFFRYFYSHACNNNRLLQRNQTTLIKDGMRLQTRRYCFILFTNRGDRTGSWRLGWKHCVFTDPTETRPEWVFGRPINAGINVWSGRSSRWLDRALIGHDSDKAKNKKGPLLVGYGIWKENTFVGWSISWVFWMTGNMDDK